MALKKKPKIRFFPILFIFLFLIFILITAIQLLSSRKVTTKTKAETPTQYLLNPSFEETVDDGDGSYDAANWKIIEGYAKRGTGDVSPEDEKKELVKVVGQNNEVTPYDGEKMIKISNKRNLKAAIMQYYTEVISTGKFTQELAVYPASNEYLQQLEVRGRPDFPEVYGLQLYSLKFSNSNIEVCVRTGGPDADHICGYDQLLPSLSKNQWSAVKTELEKIEPTPDGISQWKLTIWLNDGIIFSSGTKQYPFVQYIKDLRHVFIGDECEGGAQQKCDGPDGVIYYDASFARIGAAQNNDTSAENNTREKDDLGLVVNAKKFSNPEIVKAEWSEAPLANPDFNGFSVDIRRKSDNELISIKNERDVEKKNQKVFNNVKLLDGEYYVRLIARYENNVFKVERKSSSYLNGHITPHE